MPTVLLFFRGPGTPVGLNVYTYQWQDSAHGTTGWADIAGATTASYIVAGGETGKYLRCRVTATSSSGATVASSNVLGPIISPLNVYTYQWQASPTGSTGSWVDVPAATSASYTVDAAYGGYLLRCNVTATNAGGSGTAASNVLHVAQADFGTFSQPPNTRVRTFVHGAERVFDLPYTAHTQEDAFLLADLLAG